MMLHGHIVPGRFRDVIPCGNDFIREIVGSTQASVAIGMATTVSQLP